MDRITLILSVGGALLVVCSVYAYVLEHTPFQERDTWKTVVIGNGLILIAIGVLALMDAIDDAVYWLSVGYNIAAGTPIIIWQLTHYAREQARLNAIVADRAAQNGMEETHALNARER